MKREIGWIAFYILGLLFFLAVVSMQTKNLKNEINTAVKIECLQNSSAPIFAKYNALVQTNLDQQTTAYRLNVQLGNKAKAAADLAYAKRFRATFIHEAKPDCSKNFLK